MMTPTAKAKNNLLRSRNRLIGAALAGCSVFALNACISDGDENSKAPSTPSSPEKSVAPSMTSDPDAAAKKAILTTYDGMWAAQMKAYKDRRTSAKGTDLPKFAALNALSTLELDLRQMKDSGSRVVGTLGHAPKVTGIKSSGTPRATVVDCLDLSAWKETDSSGKVIPLPSNQPTRYQATATVEQWKTGWIVTEYTPNGERSC
ncbi:hypothetical protein ACFWN5_41950 [Streptomyces sp. NPDC058430]|uniref:hypothetical protein n=1 Tax=Streptomyces sp. NPDC058430 TaxID=3346495 RepID=UPI0036516456